MVPLKVEQVVKQFGDNTVVNEIAFEVDKGEIYGLLGANGAGKTTTMRMVLGLIYPDEGHILYDGKEYEQQTTRLLGYLPEERGLYPKVKVCDQIIYLAQLKGVSRKEADKSLKYWLDRFDVPEYYNKKVEELSKGNQQKIQFIASVIHQPRILVLDEAFSGLDPVNVELLKDTVKEMRDKGTSIVFSTHRMEHVEELCRNITILHKGNEVTKGNLKAIKKSYPKERIILHTDQSVEGLDRIPGVKQVAQHESGYELRIDRVQVGEAVLKHAMEQAIVHRFEIMEPTLNEIFIKAVGGESHE